jgi:manganese transport protein
MKVSNSDVSLSEVHNSVNTEHSSFRKRLFAFIGPAYLVSVGYMDPGNWATDLQGGSKFGYSLLWVLLMSNLMALLLQSLASRLGIVSGRDLAQANRETYPRTINFILYVLAEIAIAATDLAEVLGMAIGLHLLTGIPIIWGVAITVLDTFLLLFLQRLGMRKMEAFIIALVAIIGISFLIELVMAKPVLSDVITGFKPTIPGKQALYIAIGIIGATVMPHNLYLHSSLVQTRKIKRTDDGIKKAIRFNFFDSLIALNLAFFVNAAILILAATVFFKSGQTEVAQLKDAHQLLEGMLGNKWAPALFAIALIAAGQSSTVTGTLAGQIVMEGYLRLRINPWIRRLLTRLVAIIPAVVIILLYGDDEIDALLVLSQVILSLQLGFAIIPLIHFVSDKKRMGKFAISIPTKIASWLVAAVLVFLNLKMVLGEAMDVLQSNAVLIHKVAVVLMLLFLTGLFLVITFFPLTKRKFAPLQIYMHPQQQGFQKLEVPQFKTIAITLDFSVNDSKVISFALQQGGTNSRYLLIHVVESASAKILGASTADHETEQDQLQLDIYVNQLKEMGYTVISRLGFNNRKEAIVNIINSEGANLLVMGAHRHSGVKDWLYGETIEQVRHKLNIPLLLVNI